MISVEKAKEIRIKRANTDWWINEKAVVAPNGKTYIAYITDMGEIHVKEIDAKCSKTASNDVRLCVLNCNYADEHNAPSICVLENGKIIVAYTGHGETGYLKCRITEKPFDIFSFGTEITLPYKGSVTYAQIFENSKNNQLWLFTRVDGSSWEFRYSEDEAKTWSKSRKILGSSLGKLFYMNMRKQYVSTPKGVEEQWFFAFYGHPISSDYHVIKSGIFDSDGKLKKTDGAFTGVNLFENVELIDLEELDNVYSSPEGSTVRLLEVSATLPLRIGFATFVMDDMEAPSPEIPTYYSSTFKDGNWHTSQPICKAGEFLAKNVRDGSQTYLGGMAYYYGVGEAGFINNDWHKTETNRIYIARFDGNNRVLESYKSKNGGIKYDLEQVVRKIPKENEAKIWRPTVPIHAQDNMPVYWHEGIYNGHTGGWHCDVVALVEYDD